MKQMNICIVDDSPADLIREKEVLKKALPTASFVCVSNSAELTDFSLYDVFFLDIDLHGESGIRLAEKIHTVYPMKPVIFISGHNDLVFSSLKASPVFFIRKDSLEEDAEQAIQMLKKQIHRQSDTFNINYNGIFASIPVSDIRWFCKEHNELYIFDGTKEYRIRIPLRDALTMTGSYPMIQISSSDAINPRYISSIQNDTAIVEQREFHISRRFLPLVRKQYLMWMKGEM